MAELKNIFNVGDLVTFKTHPLFDGFRIKGDGKYVPPIMIVKEVFFESSQKKTNDEESGLLIAERIKYICVYFDDNKSEFLEFHLYESMLRTFEDLKIERIFDDGRLSDESKTIIEEIKSYKLIKYDFGKIVRFKTKKIEIFKKRSSKRIILKEGEVDKEKIKEIIQYIVNYTSPDFLICGIMNNDVKDLFYSDGTAKKLVSKKLLKIKWFNPVQHKFSEQFYPIEFFTDQMSFE
ncbi:MAG: hypothetical protein O9282_11515 [Flavobacterium sp.]|jgi:hypothetical protein|uniref:hypothetical protein n=1 Tax=Flavobacterium TaxID=237 RepID=UPI0022BB7CEF|nr:hypothetical protein [Flavobacterium sp.]MCZ8090339.1 hypothetical protein [Flavobacterium sp.]MCZ8331929.1 hypothetical protein [Flavobacterium sp.]